MENLVKNVIFGYSDVSIMPIFVALHDPQNILNPILDHHEYGAAHESYGYARV